MTTLSEIRAAASIGTVFATRMLGLFMILPIFAVAAQTYHGANPATIGLALGIYGLTQACLQMPFGMLSDRFGRKRIITLGLLLFGMGSVIAACSHTMTGLIIGRAIQGAGAIGSTCIALLADLTHAQHRTRAMAVLGMSIGLSFALAMVIGPTLYSWIHLDGIFWSIAALALLGIVVVWTWVPQPPPVHCHPERELRLKHIARLCSHPTLWRLNLGIACSHATLTALFLRLPHMLIVDLSLPSQKQWAVYLPIMGVAFICMLPLIIIAEKKQKMKTIFLLGISAMLIAIVGFAVLPVYWPSMMGCLWLFFTGFNLLEAMLPAWVSKAAPPAQKGTTTGIYSTSQFLGIFIGGASAGWLQHHGGHATVWALSVAMLLIWLWAARGLPQAQPKNEVNLNITPEKSD